MKVYLRSVWSNYEEISVAELQERIDTVYGEQYLIDEIDDNVIYVCKIEED